MWVIKSHKFINTLQAINENEKANKRNEIPEAVDGITKLNDYKDEPIELETMLNFLDGLNNGIMMYRNDMQKHQQKFDEAKIQSVAGENISIIYKNASWAPLDGGGNTTTQSTSSGVQPGGQAGSYSPATKKTLPETQAAIRRMQEVCADFGKVINNKIAKTKDEARKQQLEKSFALIDRTSKAMLSGAEADGIWGRNTTTALDQINKAISDFIGPSAQKIDIKMPTNTDKDEEIIERANKNYGILASSLYQIAPEDAPNYVKGFGAEFFYADKLPWQISPEFKDEEKNGIELPLRYLNSLTNLKAYLMKQGFSIVKGARVSGSNPLTPFFESFVNRLKAWSKSAAANNKNIKVAQTMVRDPNPGEPQFAESLGLQRYDPYKSQQQKNRIETDAWTLEQWASVITYLLDRANYQLQKAADEQSKYTDDDPEMKVATNKVNIKTQYRNKLTMLNNQLCAIVMEAAKQNLITQGKNTAVPNFWLTGGLGGTAGVEQLIGGGYGGYPGAVGREQSQAISTTRQYPFYNPQNNDLIQVKNLLMAFHDKLSKSYPLIEDGPEYLNKRNWRGGDLDKANSELRAVGVKDFGSYIYELDEFLKDVLSAYQATKPPIEKSQEQYMEYQKFMPGIDALLPNTRDNRNKQQTQQQNPATQNNQQAQQPQNMAARWQALIATGGAKVLFEDKLGFKQNSTENGGWAKVLKNGDLVQIQLNGIVQLYKKLDITSDDMSAGPDRLYSKNTNTYYI